MNTSFGRRLKQILLVRPRPSGQLTPPAAFGANDAELVRLTVQDDGIDRARHQALSTLYGGHRLT